MVEVFREVRRVLRTDGTLWLNLGDSYAGSWGNMGGRNRGAGTQRAIVNGSVVKDQTERNGDFTPPGARGFVESGIKPKDLVGIPWMLAFALRADGWWLRQDIIWAKPNPMPESVTDRCTKSHEYLFLLTKNAKYFYDQEAILEDCSPATHDRLSQNVQAQIGSERAHAGGKSNGNMKAVGRHIPGNKTHKGTTAYENGDKRMRTKAGLVDYAVKMRKLAEVGSGTKNNESFDAAMAIMPDKRNKRSVWTVATQPYSEAHFATFPEALIEPCILAGCPVGGTVLDPFGGSMTTLKVARDLQCKGIAIELNAEYIEIGKRRLVQEVFDFTATPTAEDAQ
jgi:site-specific DNA-methyltransferase (cytosine-N4-specific)